MITELSILVFTESDKNFENLRGHLKFFSSQNLQVARVKNLDEFQHKINEDHIDLCFIFATSDAKVDQNLWEFLRSPSLASRRAPLIWIGDAKLDKRFKIEQELGLSFRIDSEQDVIPGSEGVQKYLESAYQYLEFARGRTFSIVHLKPGEYLFRKGEIGDHVYVVISGRLEAREKDASEQNEIIVGQIEPGEFVGELASLQKARRMADVSAKTASELMKIPVAQFEMMLTTKLSWSNKLLHLYAKRLFELTNKISGRSAA